MTTLSQLVVSSRDYFISDFTMHKIVQVQTAAFLFCRYTIALLIWCSFIFHLRELLVVAFLVLALSYLLKVGRAPLIVLYTYTVGKIVPSKSEILDEKAMAFAHLLGTILAGVCCVLLYFVNERVGWVAVLVFAILKSISALGYCPASKLYACASNGTCCALSKRSTC
jgi:hypothetical protein